MGVGGGLGSGVGGRTVIFAIRLDFLDLHEVMREAPGHGLATYGHALELARVDGGTGGLGFENSTSRLRSRFRIIVTHDTGISAVSRENRHNLGGGGNATFLADHAVAGARGSRVVQRAAGHHSGKKSVVRSCAVDIPGDLVGRSEATILIIALGNVQAVGVGVAIRLGQITVTSDRVVRVGTADLGGLVIRGGGGGAAHEGDEGDGADHVD